jgi:glycine cleavage system H protein
MLRITAQMLARIAKWPQNQAKSCFTNWGAFMRRYTKDHEWLVLEADGVATVGITDHAQQQLGDVVFVELPALDKQVAQGAEMAVVESVKAASEVYAPVGGTVVAVNADLPQNPGLVNQSAEDAGWFVKLRLTNPADLDSLMDAAAYAAYLADLG